MIDVTRVRAVARLATREASAFAIGIRYGAVLFCTIQQCVVGVFLTRTKYFFFFRGLFCYRFFGSHRGLG